jgi:NADPH2:quinone reductase
MVVRRHGGPEELALELMDEPEPAAGDVRIRVARAGVNFSDTERRSGRHPDRRLPFVPGLEAAGVVDKAGSAIHAGLVGRRVAVLAEACYAEATTARVADLMHLPDSVAWDQAAAFPIQGLTAYHALHTVARVRAGEIVLVHAAAGGVGHWLVQLAVQAGARVFGTCSTPAKAETVRGLGATAFLYGPDVLPAVLEATGGRGADVVLDSVGRDTQETSLAVLAPFGRLVHFGTASGPPAPFDVEDLYEKSIQVGAYWLRTPLPAGAARAAVQALIDGLARGTLHAAVASVLPLERAAEAHAALESRQTQGKLLLRTE